MISLFAGDERHSNSNAKSAARQRFITVYPTFSRLGVGHFKNVFVGGGSGGPSAIQLRCFCFRFTFLARLTGFHAFSYSFIRPRGWTDHVSLSPSAPPLSQNPKKTPDKKNVISGKQGISFISKDLRTLEHEGATGIRPKKHQTRNKYINKYSTSRDRCTETCMTKVTTRWSILLTHELL